MRAVMALGRGGKMNLLFDKKYIEFADKFSTLNAHEIIKSKNSKHPFETIFNIKMDEILSFEDQLKSKFSNNYNDFWKDLYSRDANTKYVLYVDTETYFRILIQFWKSIFDSPSGEQIYDLYRLTFLDLELKRMNNQLEISQFTLPKETISFLTKTEFNKIYEEIPTVQYLQDLNKKSFGFEYLLIDYFLNENSKYKSAFLSRLEKLSWKFWVNDINEAKRDFLISFLPMYKELTGEDFNLNDSEKIHENLSKNVNTKWLLDEKINEKNYEYVKKEYPKELFQKIFQKVAASTIELEYIYEGKYLELLKLHINDSNYRQLTSGEILNQVNQQLVRYVFQLVSTNKINKFKGLSLK